MNIKEGSHEINLKYIMLGEVGGAPLAATVPVTSELCGWLEIAR
jgi:hypothetical protein